MILRYTSGYITNPETTNLSLRPSSGLSVRAVPDTFTHLKWSLVPPDFKECCIRYS